MSVYRTIGPLVLFLARIIFRNIVEIHGIGIQILYLGMNILLAGVSFVLL